MPDKANDSAANTGYIREPPLDRRLPLARAADLAADDLLLIAAHLWVTSHSSEQDFGWLQFVEQANRAFGLMVRAR